MKHEIIKPLLIHHPTYNLIYYQSRAASMLFPTGFISFDISETIILTFKFIFVWLFFTGF